MCNAVVALRYCLLDRLALSTGQGFYRGDKMERGGGGRNSYRDQNKSSPLTEGKVESIKVIIADDHPMIIAGVAAVLEKYSVDVVGECQQIADIVPRYVQLKPDAIILDIRFGDGPNGLDVARDLLKTDKRAKIVFYSQFDSDEIIREAYRLGGAAFIAKQADPAVLAEAVKEAVKGNVYFAPNIAQRMALIGVHGADSPQAKLDDREIEIFKLMAQGSTNTEIAERMKLSTRQISTISQGIKDKLGVHRPAEITRLAVKHFLITP